MEVGEVIYNEPSLFILYFIHSMKWIQCKCAEKWQDVAPLVLRLAVGAVFIVHGYQKLLDMGQVGQFFGSIGVPAPEFFAVVVSVVEFVGGIALVLGLFTHWAAKLLTINMLAAILLVHAKNGFYLNKGGMEFTLVLLATTLALCITGAGKWSFDKKCEKK